MSEVTPLEYAVYGVLAAARRETGPQGARRLGRIKERLDRWDTTMVEKALISLMERGWVRQLPDIVGMIHYEVTDG
jgi:hypothetical protein